MVQAELEAAEFTMPLPVHAIRLASFRRGPGCRSCAGQAWSKLASSCNLALSEQDPTFHAECGVFTMRELSG